MRGEAMKRVCEKLEQKGCILYEKRGLEFFAREGDWQTKIYGEKIKTLDAWEISPEFEEGLKKNLPYAKITIGNSFELALKKENQNRFDLVVFDNPQGFYGLSDCYCEHFQVLPLINNLIDKAAVIIFNINKKPFDYNNNLKWQKAREAFYQSNKTDNLNADFMLNFYANYLKGMGLKIIDCFEEKRNEEYLSYLVFMLEKN